MNQLAALIAAAHRSAETAFGTQAATYTRGEDTADVSLLIVGASAWLANPDSGVSTRVARDAFHATPAEIDFGDGPVDPSPGDEITFSRDGYDWTFTLRPPDDGQPCFGPADTLGQKLKLHAVLTAKAATEEGEE